MKKTTTIIAALLLFAATTKAQNGGFSKDDKLLNIGIGVNSYYNGGIPIGASFEKGVSDVISVGANVDYLSTKYYDYKFTALYFGVRGSYHVNEMLSIDDSKLDVYAGLTLGFRSFSWSDSYSYSSGSYGSGIYLGAYLGGKYYFSEKTGAFVELGAIGSTNARVGIAFKF